MEILKTSFLSLFFIIAQLFGYHQSVDNTTMPKETSTQNLATSSESIVLQQETLPSNATNTFYVEGILVRDKIEIDDAYNSPRIYFTDGSTVKYFVTGYNEVIHGNNKDNYTRVIDGADPKTFTALNYSYSKDKNSLYLYNKYTIDEVKKINIPGADLKTLLPIDIGILGDKSNVYATELGIDSGGIGSYVVIKNANPKTFLVTPDGITKDDKYVFTWRKSKFEILEGADPVTIRALDGGLYFFGECSYKAYYSDKSHVYYDLEPITIDFGSFVHTSGSFYAKDKNHVYYCGEVLHGADPVTFASVDYINSEDLIKQGNIDLKYFEPTQSMERRAGPNSRWYNQYVKDAQSVYFKGKVIPKADPKSFEVVEIYTPSSDDWNPDLNLFFIGRDKNTWYDEEGNVSIKVGTSTCSSGLKDCLK